MKVLLLGVENENMLSIFSQLNAHLHMKKLKGLCIGHSNLTVGCLTALWSHELQSVVYGEFQRSFACFASP